MAVLVWGINENSQLFPVMAAIMGTRNFCMLDLSKKSHKIGSEIMQETNSACYSIGGFYE